MRDATLSYGEITLAESHLPLIIGGVHAVYVACRATYVDVFKRRHSLKFLACLTFAGEFTDDRGNVVARWGVAKVPGYNEAQYEGAI